MPTPPNRDDRTVAEFVVDALGRAGVEHVFGVAGSTIMPLLDGIEDDPRLGWVGARYELSAAEMASGYARATGRLGVVMTHCGPGATGVVTALAGALRDDVPLFLVTGNEESTTLPRVPYHDWELMAVMRPLTRFSEQVTRPDDVPHLLRRALTEAGRGSPAPVHLDLPEDIALERVAPDELALWWQQIAPVLDAMAASPRLPLSRPAPSGVDVDRTVALLAAASAPIVVVGEAAGRGPDRAAVLDAVAGLGLPYVTTFGGRGGIGERPGYVGTVGRFGPPGATDLLGRADVVLALGAELSDVDTVRWRVPSPDAKLVAVHPDPGKVDRRLPTTLGVVADVGEFLAALTPAWGDGAEAVPEDWRAAAAAVERADGPAGNPAAEADPPLDALLVSRVIDAAPDDWVVSMDPGFAPLSLSAPAEFGGSHFLYAVGMGAMGFAVPAAIGAVQDDDVHGGLAVVGDGSLFMSLSSLESIASLDAPVVVVVVDDGGFGSQRKKQREGYGRNVGVDYDNPDIAAISEAMGIEATWIRSADDVEALCASLPGRTRGAVAVVTRDRDQGGTWYEGSVTRR